MSTARPIPRRKASPRPVGQVAPLQGPNGPGADENTLRAAIGGQVRTHRERHGVTITELAGAAGISVSTLSKIEKGTISASVATLQSLSRALGVPLSTLMQRSEERHGPVFVRAGGGVAVERGGSRAGQLHHMLGGLGASAGDTALEPYLITLTGRKGMPPSRQGGTTFLYVLQGEIVYRHGPALYQLRPGDSLLLDAASQHGPHRLVKSPVKMLCVSSPADEPGRPGAPRQMPARTAGRKTSDFRSAINDRA